METVDHLQQQPNEQVQTDPHKRNFFPKIAMLCGIIAAISIGAFFFLNKNTPSKSLPDDTNQSIHSAAFKQWVNCDDLRDVIEEKGNVYLSCLGGVIVVDVKTGDVIDQITMTGGLGNSTTTSLVKKQNDLYIGTQDGFTIFNTLTRSAKKMSVKEGLVNGANVEVFDDDDVLWIATFDGLSRFNPKSGELTNFTTDLADNATKFGVDDVSLTPNAVYAALMANAYTPGSIARYDRKANTWERFGPASFPTSDENDTRIDFGKIAAVQGKVFVAENSLWQSEDKPNVQWERLQKLETQIAGANLYTLYIVGQDGHTVWIRGENGLYTYNPSDEMLTKLTLKKHDGKELDYGEIVKVTDQKVWYRTTDGWIGWVDLATQRAQHIPLLGNRPKMFGTLVTVIDNSPITTIQGQLWRYDESKQTFVRLVDLSQHGFDSDNGGGSGAYAFQPINGSKEVFIFEQVCGQGCHDPKVGVLDFSNNSFRPIPISQEIIGKIKTAPAYEYTGWDAMNYRGYDSEKNEFMFTLGYEEKTKATISTEDFTWKVTADPTGKPLQSNMSVKQCNKTYTFARSNNVFSKAACRDSLENEQYSWEITKADNSSVATLEQTDKKTGNESSHVVPLVPPEYSPFNEKGDDYTQLKNAQYVEGRVWIATNRGLAAYDPKADSWKLYTVKEGLVRNDVDNFIVDGDTLWVNTVWGGLSRLQL